MLSSMTGFGRGEVTENGTTVTVEIRSVNNRYCEVALKLPTNLQTLENELRDIIQKQIDRGKIHVVLRVDENNGTKPKLAIDKDLAASYHSLLMNLKKELHLSGDILIQDLLRFESIFKSAEESEEVVKHLHDMVLSGLNQAILSLREMRQAEGLNLARELELRLTKIDDVVTEIESESAGRVKEAKAKLEERIKILLDSDQFDNERLELEIALLADKLDITEELVRLRSHLLYFKNAIDSPEPAGRKLNFLIQEMHREVNTLGAKASHAGIAHKVVVLKEALEIIREQIQNIE